MVIRTVHICLTIALAFSLSAVAKAQVSASNSPESTGQSIEALTRQSVDILERKDQIVRNVEALKAKNQVTQVAKDEDAFFRQLLNQATATSEEAMNAAAVRYGLQPPKSKPDGINASHGDEGVRYRLYVSMAMGEAALKQAMEYGIKYNRSMVLAMRGPMPGEKLDPMIYRMMNMIGGVHKGMEVPNIEINPPSFTQNSVTTVPTLVALDGDGQVVAKVRGVMNPEWIEDEIKAGHKGDLGAHGATTEIAEIDLLEAIIAKAKADDPKALAEKARRDIWKGIPFQPLPETREKRIRELDPGFTVTEDIPLPDGTFLARKGDYINPLDQAEFSFPEAIVVIDATKPDQVRFARILNRELKDNGVITLLSNLDREKGWETLGGLAREFAAQPYLLTSDIKQRFRLESVPTVITVVDKKILVQELPTSIMESK